MEFDNLYDEYQMKKIRKMKKAKGGVFGIPNLGIIDRMRGNVYNPDNPDKYNPSTPEDLRRDLERDAERRRRRIIDAEGFDMVGRNEIDDANIANLQRQDGIEMRGQGASGGLIPFLNPMNMMNPMGMMNPQMLANFMPMPSALRGLIGKGENGASGGFFPLMMAAQMAGLDPIKQIRGLIGMGKNRKDILYYPKDEVSGGFFNPMTLMSMASMAPSLLQNLPLGAIFGKGKNNLQFIQNPEIEKISLKGVKGGAFMDSFNNIARSIVNNPVVRNEARQALNRFNQSNIGQDLAEARRTRLARGGISLGDVTGDILGAMDSTNTAKSLGARLALSQVPGFNMLPTFLRNRALGLIGLGKNKNVVFIPNDEVRGGFGAFGAYNGDLTNLFKIAQKLPSFISNMPLGEIFGKGKNDFEFQLNPELMKKIQKRGVKGGSIMDAVNSITQTILTDPAVRNEINKFRRTDTGRNVINTSRSILNTGLDLVEANKIRKARGGTQYLKDFGSGFLMVNRPVASLANTAALASALPIPGAQFLKPIAMAHNLVNGAMGFLTGNGDPREYRRPSHAVRNKQLAMANNRGIETSDAKGGYVHRPTKMHGGAQCGNMSAVGGARSARSAIVKEVMNERGVGLIEASKIVKNEGLY